MKYDKKKRSDHRRGGLSIYVRPGMRCLTAMALVFAGSHAIADDAPKPDVPLSGVLITSVKPLADIAKGTDKTEKVDPAAEQGKSPLGAPDESGKKSLAALSPFAFGADLYFGGTNSTGARARNNDGMWAGYGPALPSLFSFKWRPNEGNSLYVSAGIGDMYNAKGTPLRQPVEAYYQTSMKGGASLTVGKFYVPFANYEWEYEPKYGMMMQKSFGRMTYTGSMNYNFNRKTPNAYLHMSHQAGPATTVGLSAGGGKGLFSNSSHVFALGMDMNHDFGGVQFSSEYSFAGGINGPFQFVYGKLALTRMGKFVPYVGAYYWRDTAQEFGQFSSALVGMGYKLTPSFALEGAYARASGRNVFWFQSHVTY